MWPFKRTVLPPPSPDRALDVAMVQRQTQELTRGLRHELDALEATLIRQKTGVIPPKEGPAQ